MKRRRFFKALGALLGVGAASAVIPKAEEPFTVVDCGGATGEEWGVETIYYTPNSTWVWSAEVRKWEKLDEHWNDLSHHFFLVDRKGQR